MGVQSPASEVHVPKWPLFGRCRRAPEVQAKIGSAAAGPLRYRKIGRLEAERGARGAANFPSVQPRPRFSSRAKIFWKPKPSPKIFAAERWRGRVRPARRLRSLTQNRGPRGSKVPTEVCRPPRSGSARRRPPREFPPCFLQKAHRQAPGSFSSPAFWRSRTSQGKPASAKKSNGGGKPGVPQGAVPIWPRVSF